MFTGVAAVPVRAAEGGGSFTLVTVNDGKPIVIGDKEEWRYIDPRYPGFGNEDAGGWKTAARLFLSGDAHDTGGENLPLQIALRRDLLTRGERRPDPGSTVRTSSTAS